VTLRGAESVPDAKNTIQAALEATICMKKLARVQNIFFLIFSSCYCFFQTELSVELSVLANDGGIVAAALIAAGLALSSASIEQFDLLLACHIMVDPRNGECTLDPEMEQIRSCTFKPALITTGVIPSLGQIACLDVGGAPLSLPVLKRAIRVGYDYCLQLYTPISKYLIAYVESSNPTSSSPSPEPM
jgi:hypothetical protein